MKILVTYGTRPEFIKVSPVIDEMKKRGIQFKTLFTGQHKDLLTNNADYNHEFIDFSGNRLDSVLKNCLSLNDEYFNEITHILVQGDTTSVLGLAITAMHRGLKIIHLEAGLRTYDSKNPFPEENNRRLVSAIADVHLCPTMFNRENLINEGIDEYKIYVVGNTGLDNIKKLLIPVLPTTNEKYQVLITLHRRENHERMNEWFNAIDKLATFHNLVNFVIPLHPNPMVQKHKNLLTHVNIVEPMTHFQLINVAARSRLIITDSGGLQEECSFLRKKALVCRRITERPESLGVTSFLINEPADLEEAFNHHFLNNVPSESECPYGDGHASEKICDIFETLK